MNEQTIRVGHVLDVLRDLPDNHFHCITTSPPYYGLRSYGTDPQTWGGDHLCDHEWVTERRYVEGGGGVSGKEAFSQPGPENAARLKAARWKQDDTCAKCGAWRGELGQEPTLTLFVEHLVEVFREVRRVLHPTGVCFVNMGDSYGRHPSKGQATGSANGRHAHMGDAARRSAYIGDGIKEKDLMMVPETLALALRADGWYLRSKMPWLKRNCLSGGTRVYARTQKGEMPMTIKDLVHLDPSTVQLWNGEKWTQAIDWWETPRPGAPLEIELRSGERIGCTADHRWPTQRGVIPASELVVGDVIQTTKLPEPESPRRPDMLPDYDVGWFAGLYLAEGHRSGGTITISGHKKETERWERLRLFAEQYDGSFTVWESEGGNAARGNLRGPIIDGIIDAYISGEGAERKHLSMRCWKRSDDFLRGLLEGYLHGDAHYDRRNDRYRIGFCNNDAWAVDLRTLCARLGVELRLGRTTHRIGVVEYPGWRGSIHLKRRAPSAIPGTFAQTNPGEVVAIGQSRTRKFWDIAVEDEPHLFALASGVLTHNSMPESVTDRPGTSVEWVYMLTKSPQYFWDRVAVMRQSSPDMVKRAANGHTRGGTKIASTRGDAATLRSGENRLVSASGRNMRNGDLFYDSLILDEDGDPIALDVNPQPFKGAHFAVFSPKLITPLIKAATSEIGCCAECGSPWRRVVERTTEVADFNGSRFDTGKTGGHHSGTMQAGERFVSRPIGWEPSCTCHGRFSETNDDSFDIAGVIAQMEASDRPQTRRAAELFRSSGLTAAHAAAIRSAGAGDVGKARATQSGTGKNTEEVQALADEAKAALKGYYREFLSGSSGKAAKRVFVPTGDDPAPVPCRVLDPFVGSGTTLIVASRLGRDGTGIELNPQYAAMALDRVHADAPMLTTVAMDTTRQEAARAEQLSF